MNFVQIESEILSLPAQDRAALAQRLLLSLEEVSESEFEKLWAEESVYRIAKYDSGNTQAIPGEEVAKKARALLR